MSDTVLALLLLFVAGMLVWAIVMLEDARRTLRRAQKKLANAQATLDRL